MTGRAGALVLGAALLGLLAVAPHRSALPGSAPPVPRQTALDRIREGGGDFRQRYVRIDGKEAKLLTLAEWDEISGSVPPPAQPTRAPGSMPGPVGPPAPRLDASPEAQERLVWVVVAHGNIAVDVPAPPGSLQRPTPAPYPWTGVVLDAQTGEIMQSFARLDDSWVLQWRRQVDRDPARTG